eukprot:5409704-Amphidinium_carterae.1
MATSHIEPTCEYLALLCTVAHDIILLLWFKKLESLRKDRRNYSYKSITGVPTGDPIPPFGGSNAPRPLCKREGGRAAFKHAREQVVQQPLWESCYLLSGCLGSPGGTS